MSSPGSELVDFWDWFASIAKTLEEGELSDSPILTELGRRIFNIDSRLNWEVGPTPGAGSQLVISPNYDEELVPLCQSIVTLAPNIGGWKFYAYKPRRRWTNEVILEGQQGDPVRIDTRRWTYVILRYKDEATEVLLSANEALPFDPESQLRWIAGALVLEALLGEELVMSARLSWDLLDHLEPQFQASARPLSRLPEAFGLPTIN
jgi:hypothetical protein